MVDSPGPAGAVQVGGEAARRLLADQLVAVVGLADRDVRRRQVDAAPSRRPARRTTTAGSAPRRPRRSRRAGRSSGRFSALEQQLGAERHAPAPSRSISSRRAQSAGRELARLVELAVVRQVGLRHHAEQRGRWQTTAAQLKSRSSTAQRQADERGQRQSCASLQRARASAASAARRAARAGGTGRRRCRPTARARGKRRATAFSRAASRISSSVASRLYCGSATRTAGVATATRANPWR